MTVLFQETLDAFGYDFHKLTPKSKKKIKVRCDYCQKTYETTKQGQTNGQAKFPKDSCFDCRYKKLKDANIAKYGVSNVFASEQVKETIKKTCQEKYGVDAFTQTQDFKDKAKITNLERYGVEHAMQSDEMKEKISNTLMERYGVSNASQSPEIRAKVKATYLERYGVEEYLSSQEAKDKSKQTCLEKYGVENVFANKEVQAKIKASNLERHGVEYPMSNPDICQKGMQSKLEKYGTLAGAYGKTQDSIKEWLKSCGFEFKSNTSLLCGREIDLYNDQLKLGIEYCGLRWHSDQFQSDNSYHYKKYKGLLAQNIKLITIFEDEWLSRENQVKSFISSKLGLNKKIYARNCEIKTILKKEAVDFIEANHIIGMKQPPMLAFGIYKDNELYGVITFRRHHRNSIDITLNRMCFKSGYTVVGGFSRIMKLAIMTIKQMGYSKIITWSDNRWSNGEVYAKNGFVLEAKLKPDYSYVKDGISKRRFGKQDFRKSNINCPNNLTEKEYTAQLGFHQIWDCGKNRWVLHI